MANNKQEKERRGDYLGKSRLSTKFGPPTRANEIPPAVQVVPHITNAIQEGIERVANTPVDDSGEAPDVCIGKSLAE